MNDDVQYCVSDLGSSVRGVWCADDLHSGKRGGSTHLGWHHSDLDD